MTKMTERFHYLDAVRAFALMLGIVFHASLSFMPIFIGWAVMDISTSDIASIFVLVSHSFRMEVFFLVAGFFSHMKLQQTGPKNWLQSRFMRIGLPFLVFWFLLRPLLVSGWHMGSQSLQGDVDTLGSLWWGVKSLIELPESFLTGTHLWFLYYLLLISVLILCVRQLLNYHTATKKRIQSWADNTTRWLSESRLAPIVAALPISLCLWFMQRWGVDTPDQTLIPHIPVTLLYGGFFMLGWQLHRQTDLLSQFAQFRWDKTIMCIIAFLTTLVLAEFEMQPAHPDYLVIKGIFCFSYAVMMWTLVQLFISLCKKLFSIPSSKIRYLADASYWLYLIHLPIVVWLQVAFAEIEWPWFVKLPLIVTITVAISLVLYEGLVRSTLVGKLLNGKKLPGVIHR